MLHGYLKILVLTRLVTLTTKTIVLTSMVVHTVMVELLT